RRTVTALRKVSGNEVTATIWRWRRSSCITPSRAVDAPAGEPIAGGDGHRARAPRRQQRLAATSACCLNDQYDALATPMPRHLAALTPCDRASGWCMRAASGNEKPNGADRDCVVVPTLG